jgi:UTP--glucose-1-phosphate uridylyltransferase
MTGELRYSVIPAAGLATRFLPASKAIPKELFPILNKPAIQYVIEESVGAEIDRVVFVSGAGKEALLDHFDKINPKFPVSRLNSQIQENVAELDDMIDVISIRQKTPKGLGHAVLKGCEVINGEPFAVLLPDMMVLSKGGETVMQRLVGIYKNFRCSVIALMKVPAESKGLYGIAEGKKIDKDLIEISKLIEKPKEGETDSDLAIVGRYIFTPAITGYLSETQPDARGEIQLTNGIEKLISTEHVYGLILDENDLVFDTGTPEGFAIANAYMAMQKNPNVIKELDRLAK